MLEAKSSLSRLVEALEQGEEQEIIIARNGRPAAKLVPMKTSAEGALLKLPQGCESGTNQRPSTRWPLVELYTASSASR